MSSRGSVSEQDVEAPMAALSHRGPDGSDAWSDRYCAIGHQRLAIIDLSARAMEPLPNERRDMWLSFNGEIYNHVDLRDDLRRKGHVFASETDAEVVVHGYEEWGTDVVHRLRGMFAFAVWDQRARSLFLARDRLGKKPLFYTVQGDRFMFASELQGVLAFEGVPREPDMDAVDAYLSWGYVPAPRTGFSGISKIEPAHWMKVLVEGEGLQITSDRYWSLEYMPKLDIREEDAARRLRDLVEEAVRLRLMTDVPLGAFLSGGVDSSIVVGLMAQLSSAPVKTFSIGFQEAPYNELGHARRVAQLWRTDHNEFTVRPDALEVLPQLVRHYGEPYADTSAIPTYYLAQLTSRSVKVALNGDGGDEAFAGYDRYRAHRRSERLRAIPGSGALMRTAAAATPASEDAGDLRSRLRRFLTVASWPRPERYGRWQTYFWHHEKKQMYGPDIVPLISGWARDWWSRLVDDTYELDAIDAALAVDVASYLAFDLLPKVDIAAMAWSLEPRSPLLDQEVMSFAARLPVDLKLKRHEHKRILVKAFGDLLPDENVNRPKMGFGVPLADWFRGPLKEVARAALEDPSSALMSYFRPQPLEQLLDDHLAGRADHSARIWNLVFLESWDRQMLGAGGR
ncbi:MAG: asparagine synthase (glutamine-hydrolyzing) [Actinomycetota bacterium]|nr:asparagine synthase (glutamine-hydrolyzing) [Actinomycetota bacterium]